MKRRVLIKTMLLVSATLLGGIYGPSVFRWYRRPRYKAEILALSEAASSAEAVAEIASQYSDAHPTITYAPQIVLETKLRDFAGGASFSSTHWVVPIEEAQLWASFLEQN